MVVKGIFLFFGFFLIHYSHRTEMLLMKINENIPLTIYYELGSTRKKIDDLLSITKGTLYRLENSSKNVVRIMLENQEIGTGKILTKSGKMYVEITELKNQ